MHVPTRLVRHLESWLGTWPIDAEGSVVVVGSSKRDQPGWDGSIRPVVGVSTPRMTVLSVPPRHVAAVEALGDEFDRVAAGLPAAIGRPGERFFTGVMRWSDDPVPAEPRGVWLPTDDPRVLPWLRPFNGEVLVGFDGDEVTAGVGRKIHDAHGHELAVVTEPPFRGRGWAVSLVCQAARRVLDDGAIPTYMHGAGNVGSARTADKAGFPDRGWRIHGVSARRPG